MVKEAGGNTRERNRARQHRFVQEYLKDLNASQAAARAGYSKKTAGVQGYQLLQKPSIQKAIAAAQKRRAEKLEITAEKWLRELAIIAYSDLGNYTSIDPDTGAIRAKGFEDMPIDTSRALESIQEDRTIREDASGNGVVVHDKVKFKLHSKLEALKLIGEHAGFLKGQMPMFPANVMIVVRRQGPEDKP